MFEHPAVLDEPAAGRRHRKCWSRVNMWHASRRRRRRRWGVGPLFFLTASSLTVALIPTPATAGHHYDPYRLRGYVWTASFYDYAVADIVSNNCNPREEEAYNRVKASTVGEFPNKWPSGILFRRAFSNDACGGKVNSSVDIRLKYQSASNFVRDDGSTYGGYNVSYLAPRSWCRIWGAGHPCGSHPSVVHLNNSRFGADSYYSEHYRRRLIMHETGHSLGLAHHCGSDAIMNDGTSGCNGGAFTNINGYQEPDRDGIRGMYPNWRY